MELLAIGTVFAVMVVVAVARRQRVQRATTVEVVADADGVRRLLADGRREEVRWPEVSEIDVFVTRVGPHKAAGGALVLFGDAKRGCVIPLDRLAESGVLDHAHRLPGFDPATVVAAVSEPGHDTAPRALLSPRPLQRTTVCWRREDT